MKRKEQGFSLVEILISVLIISVAVVATVKLQKHLFLKSSQAEARLVALELAQAKMEDFKDFLTVDDFNAIATGNEVPQHYGIFTYEVKWQVEELKLLDGVTNPKKIDISVAWQGINQTSHEVQLSGFLSPLSHFSSDNIFKDLTGN
ncbi:MULTISPECIES: prepilin-type N-terminal cleavage/methylation domain-containing protein [unclassified Motilimonas]|uniref:type IV pilus modification PilV family protein n=1 Tax=Motilimonas TaxID=1914248 RepID=UPI001E3539A2|nr:MULTISPECIES: prepilin-type N-terminal cleavage/methylation domain-containing protein [unclassified Motilimonas]MCE0555996.1 prepilin-type N-terminal cleavage/methylation domain-containing protein [Motilimonas sp. E26]MDO6526449.1 prepilin-type N-terminal cleavage/methylation domain-containing protein [Motilimonas sp. 1_MG-2023]